MVTQILDAQEQIDEIRSAKQYVFERLMEVQEERDRLKAENERLRNHVRDLNADLEGTLKECREYHGEARSF